MWRLSCRFWQIPDATRDFSLQKTLGLGSKRPLLFSSRSFGSSAHQNLHLRFQRIADFARIQAEKPHGTQGALERPFVGLSAAKNHDRNDYDKN